MKNIFSIDLESWVHFYEDSLKIEKFDSNTRKSLDAGYIPKVVNDLLDLLDKYNQKATFFIVSELYDWYPKSIEEIKKRGHEIGYHTHTHSIVKNSIIMKDELAKSKEFIKKFKPKGFRAPLIYITEDSFKYLEKYGFKYSSSTYDEHKITKYGKITEIPVSTITYSNKRFDRSLPKNLSPKAMLKKLPFGSGLFLCLFGSKTSFFIRKFNKRNIPAILFIHPWQLYQPKQIRNLGFKLKIAAKNPLCIPYTRNILKSIEKLLKSHKFTTFQEYFDE